MADDTQMRRGLMEERVGRVEGKVDRLELWRKEQVDPHIVLSEEFDAKVSKFLTTYETEQKISARAQEARHAENTDKLNRLNLIGTVGLLLVGLFGLTLTVVSIIIAIVTLRHTGYAAPPLRAVGFALSALLF